MKSKTKGNYRKVGGVCFDLDKPATKVYGTPPNKESTIFTGLKTPADPKGTPEGWYILQYTLNADAYYLRTVEEIKPKLSPKKTVHTCNPSRDLKRAKKFKSKASAARYLRWVNNFLEIKTPMARVLYFGPKETK